MLMLLLSVAPTKIPEEGEVGEYRYGCHQEAIAESELKHLLLVGEELEEGAGEEGVEDTRDEGDDEAYLQCDADDQS